MGRKSFAIKEVEQLKEMVKFSINLCDVCQGCKLKDAMIAAETDAWKDHRQGIQQSIYRCNSFKKDPRKRKIAPALGGN